MLDVGCGQNNSRGTLIVRVVNQCGGGARCAIEDLDVHQAGSNFGQAAEQFFHH